MITIQSGYCFDAGKSTFRIVFKEMPIDYQVMSVNLLPSEKFSIALQQSNAGELYFARFNSDETTQPQKDGWHFTAPEIAGIYPLHLFSQQSEKAITLNIIVLVPLSEVKKGKLRGYRIGDYPGTAYKNLAIYKPPRGFIEVTPENEDTYLSPHFQLKQFLCKQDDGYPKYVVIRPMLLQKLELILETVNNSGYACGTLHIMSGYRTPFYNKAIGNVKYSRHVWGGAADIFIDVDLLDGNMDDLNKDGVVNYKDAAVLYDWIDDLYGETWYTKFVGGLGLYRKTLNHGPFVHVDVRGYRARWGD
ncbi:D-Ala-D-Ala carboxypeptidase family metallohydrolase [Calditrichota bacterium]